MCRLFAWVQPDTWGQPEEVKEKKKEVLKIIKGLLVAEAASNPDGVGLCGVPGSESKKFLLWKRPYNGLSALIRDNSSIEFIVRNSQILVGHVRYMTHGEVSYRNTHPFVFSMISGAHNGVFNVDDLKKFAKKLDVKVSVNKKEKKESKESESDSRLFFRILNKILKQKSVGLDEALKELLAEVEGDYTLLLFWRKDLNLYCIRKGRPLMLFSHPEYGKFLISTKEMAEKAIILSGISQKNWEIQELKENMLYKVSALALEEIKEIKSKEKILWDWNWDNYYYNYYLRNSYSSYGYRDRYDDYENGYWNDDYENGYWNDDYENGYWNYGFDRKKSKKSKKGGEKWK